MNRLTRPKNPDGVLRVILLGRVSTDHQNIENITASQDQCERKLHEMFPEEMIITRLGDRGSGWKAERNAIDEAKRMIESGCIDIVMMEDLSRAFRNPAFQFDFAHLCVDNRTRLICPGDGIDTATPNFEQLLHTAVLRHGITVPEVRRRVRRTADYEFQKGGMVCHVPFGYRRVSRDEAASSDGERMARETELTPVLKEMKGRFLRGDTYEMIARWLNGAGISPGPYATSGVWTGKLVKQVLSNPVLHGERIFRRLEYQIVYKTGDHKRIANERPEIRNVPALAHFTAEEHEVLLSAMKTRQLPRKLTMPGGRKNISRKSSYWPGQHLKCCICGDPLYWLSRGQLRCCNAGSGRIRSCWNQTIVQAEQVRLKVLPRILSEIRKRPDAYRILVDVAWADFRKALNRSTGSKERLDREISSLHQDAEKIVDLLLSAKNSEPLLARLKFFESELKSKRAERKALDASLEQPLSYASRDAFEADLGTALLELSRSSFELDDVLRRMLPDFVLIPTQDLESGQIRPRIRLRFPAEGVKDSETVEIVIDAFEPPLHIRFAEACALIRAANPEWTLEHIAKEAGTYKKVACDALRYWGRMQEAGLSHPYRELVEPPENAPRWRKGSTRNGSPSGDNPESRPETVA